MFPITPIRKIYLACQSVDFRKGIDGYAAICRLHFQLNPFGGHCFIFRNRRRTAIKILVYEYTGFWLCHKRLSKGTFKNWPVSSNQTLIIDEQQLNVLLRQ
jgi:transposase